MNSKQHRKTRRFMIGMFNQVMVALDVQVTKWENDPHLTKDKIISELRMLIKKSKKFKK